MNIASNPWSFVPSDILLATPAASPGGLVQQAAPALATVLLTTTGAHGLSAGQYITIVGTTGGTILGWFKVLNVPSGTTALLQWLSTPKAGTPPGVPVAADGGGTLYLNQVQQNVRVEDISWQNPTSGSADSLLMYDRNGNLIWQAAQAAGATTGNAQNRGKIMWVDGITLATLSNGIVFATIN